MWPFPTLPCGNQGPTPKASPRCGLRRTLPLLPYGSCFLQSRPGAVRVSLVKVLLRRRGTLRASELGIDYVFHVQPDVTSRAL